MRTQRKFLAILMALCLMISMMPMAAFADGNDTAGQTTESNTWGAGYDETDSFTISSKEDLLAFAAMVNDESDGKDFSGKTVTLTAAIDLTDVTWTPIGNGTRSSSAYTGNSFKGTFDGNNCTISNLTINSGSTDNAIGLFGVVDGGTVKNLTLSNVSIDVSSEQAGSAIGLMVNNATAAGITVSSGSVKAVQGAGGIVGRMTIEGTISDCVNNAAVTAKTGGNAGGIVGAAYYNAVDKDMDITNCTNHGAVTGVNNVGGIVGLSAANVSGCENDAKITGSSYSVGGIVGEQQNSGSIKDNTNAGNVTSSTSQIKDYGIGGIVGWVRYSGSDSAYPKKEVVSVTGNTNSGSVSFGGSGAGGIIGVLYNAGTVTGNENQADKIEANTNGGFAAGIVGSLQATNDTNNTNAFYNELDIKVTNNVSTTTVGNITGSYTDLYAYNNKSSEFVVENNGSAWVAEVGENRYVTIQAAIDAAKTTAATVTLLDDTTEDITIAEGQNITLDLNNQTLTNKEGDTISNYGTLIIKDSGTNGTVDNITNYKGALVNYVGGNVTINSGTLTRSKEASNNSWYTIKNLGTMEINGGTVTLGDTTTNFSSLIDNGWYSGNANPNNVANDRNVTHTNGQVATLKINGGTFSGGKYTVKNDDYGEMTINEGTFNAFTEACVLNWNVAEIAGGTFTGTGANEVIYNGAGGNGDAGQLTITGGQFTSGDNRPVITGASDLGTIEIKSGTFIAGANGDIISTSDTNATIKVSGGNYSESIPVDYLDNLNAELYSTAVNSKAPYSYYENVSAALAVAQVGDTVKDLSANEGDENTTTYTVTFEYGYGEDVTVTVTSGTSITLPNPTRSGYTFQGWYNGSTKVVSSYTVTADITLTAQWSYNGSSSTSGGSSSSSTTYSVSVDTAKNGTVSVSPKNASKGTTVTITAKPADGYEVDEVTVTDKNGDTVKVTAKGNDKYTFVMPAGKVDVEVTFVKEYVAPAISFTDVKSNAWYYDAALYAAENGLMSGTGSGAFSPDLTTSRAMIWTILARVDGQNISVTYGNWYDKAQSWAISAGVSDGTNPDNPITREQLAVMLYGFAKDQGYTTANGVALSRYVDASDVSSWAVEALEWAVGNGLISSMGSNILAPTGTATRAQVAVILMNFCENIAK